MAQHHFPPNSHARQDANSKHKHNNRDINLDKDEKKHNFKELTIRSSCFIDNFGCSKLYDVSNAKSYDKVPNSVFVKFDKSIAQD